MTALVIGGGLAGSAVAIRLAQAGRAVTLVEREARPHDKVCGEFLSAQACDLLHRLGLDPDMLGGRPIGTVALHHRDRTTSRALPFAALGLSRLTLDEALLQRAASYGVEVLRGLRATAVEGEPGGWRVRTDGGPVFTATDVFIATGKHNMRGAPRGEGLQSDLIGFKQHLRLTDDETRALEGRVELHLFPGGYAGLQRVEDGLANLCLVVRRDAFSRRGGKWEDLRRWLETESPALARRLAGSTSPDPRPVAIGAIPYGHVSRDRDGLWRLGDQAAVIPSFAGEGMSIALLSGWMAADHLLAGKAAESFQTTLAGLTSARVRGATRLSQLLVRPLGQAVASAVVALQPALLGWIAARTRIEGYSAA